MRKLSKLFIGIISSFLLYNCTFETSTSVLSGTSSGNYNPNSLENATEVIWNGYTDFNNSDWKVNIQVPAEKFSSISEGSKIQIEWKNSITATEYKKLQLDSAGSSWSELTGGSVNGGEKETGVNSAGYKLISSPLVYTLTASNANELRANGLAIMGYGVIVTKISLITGDAEPIPPQQDNGSSGNTENNPPSNVTTKAEPVISDADTPFAKHGKLHVDGAYLKDKSNEKYQLFGMSTHGLNFGDNFSKYVNKESFKTLRDDWNTNCIRLVLYPKDYNGYCNGGNKDALKQIMKNGIEYATELGMYVLVDWHVHEFNPNDLKEDAKLFLAEFAKEYANYGNVLYEICNEPTNAPWDTAIKPYAEEVIPSIRQYAKDAVIIVGTNSWSQDIGDAYNNPLDTSKYGNVMYTFHFYANSHSKLYSSVEDYAKKGFPIFITEFGTCNASGNGGFNKTESEKWFNLCKTYNISHMNWSLCNKGETASAILSSCDKTSGWTDSDLTESGKLVKTHFINDCVR